MCVVSLNTLNIIMLSRTKDFSDQELCVPGMPTPPPPPPPPPPPYTHSHLLTRI